MIDRYKIAKIHIGPFFKKNNNIVFDKNLYPERLCVIDKENNIAIDVNMKMQYPYLETINSSFLHESVKAEQIVLGKRYACFEYFTFACELDNEMIEKVNRIMKLLNKKKVFSYGNESLSNNEYLDALMKKTEFEPCKLKKLVRVKKK